MLTLVCGIVRSQLCAALYTHGNWFGMVEFKTVSQWVSKELLKFGQNSKHWSKLWFFLLQNLVKYYWNSKIWSKFWNLVEILKFWNLVQIQNLVGILIFMVWCGLVGRVWFGWIRFESITNVRNSRAAKEITNLHHTKVYSLPREAYILINTFW